MPELTIAQMLWIGVSVLAAYVVRGMSGFGAGLVAAPLLAFVLPVQVIVPTTGLLVFILFVFLTLRDRRNVIWKELKALLLPTIAGVGAGLVLFRMLDNRLLLIGLACFLIVYALYMIAVHTLGLPEFKCSERWAFPLGFAGSFFDTMFGGGGGTLVVIYMHARGIGRTEFRATLAMLWFFEMLARIAGYGLAGFYTRGVLILVVALVPIVWVGTWIGEHIGNRVSPETFARILAVVLLASGVSLLIKS